MRTAALFLAMVLIPVNVAAQEVARSLEQLNRRQVLREGETALESDLSIISADAVLPRYPGVKVVWR